jgi:hypothetical protein
MRTIYKYELKIVDLQEIELPVGANIISAQVQNGKVYVWAIVNTELTPEFRTIIIYGTGNPMYGYSPTTHNFIGTVQDGQYVWHIFEV